MSHVDLLPDDGSTSWPAWVVIEAARHHALTGRLSLDTSPPTDVYLRDGEIYLAARSTDAPLTVRLLIQGVLTREQLQRGAIVVNGTEHLGRLFERDHTIDRGPVEVQIEVFTEEVLFAVANEVISSYRMEMYRRHPSGVDRWSAATAARIVPLPPRVIDQPPPRRLHTGPIPAMQTAITHQVTQVSDPLAGLDSVASNAIADEVEEAVRRALAAIEAAGRPPLRITPADFGVGAVDAPGERATISSSS